MGRQRVGVRESAAVRSCAKKTEVLLAETRRSAQAKLQPELRVVAERWVRVQRQVVGEQVDVVGQQQRQTLLHPPGDATIVSAPEQSVVDQYGVGASVHRGLDQRTTGGDAGHNFSNDEPTLDLKAVGPVVAKPRRLKHGVKRVPKLDVVCHGETGRWCGMKPHCPGNHRPTIWA